MDEGIIAQLCAREPGEQVVEALRALLEHDAYLLACDANERSIAHRFAMYLQGQFPEWHVDCEYNRDGVDPKRIGHLGLDPDAEDTEGQTVFPDVIVHRRGTDENHLVIEVKKASSAVDRNIDRQKLRGYMRDLNYRFALFIEFGVGEASGVSVTAWMDG